MMAATISKKGAEAPLVLAETFKIMGAEITPITDGIIANFGEINNLESMANQKLYIDYLPDNLRIETAAGVLVPLKTYYKNIFALASY